MERPERPAMNGVDPNAGEKFLIASAPGKEQFPLRDADDARLATAQKDIAMLLAQSQANFALQLNEVMRWTRFLGALEFEIERRSRGKGLVLATKL